VICTCGDWDFKTMFPTEIKRKKLDGLVPRWLKAGWCNVKVYFESCTGTKARGMPGMLDSLRLPLIGRHHRSDLSPVLDSSSTPFKPRLLLHLSPVFAPSVLAFKPRLPAFTLALPPKTAAVLSRMAAAICAMVGH